VENEMLSEESAIERAQFARLVRVLDRPLFRLAARTILDEAEASNIDLAAERMLIDSDGMVLVSIKIDQEGDGIMNRLQESGLEIIGSDSTGSFILGRVSVDDLIGLGLSDGVLRVVPTTMKPAE